MLPVRVFSLVFGISYLIWTPQSKEFQIGDVVANLLGSSVGLYISYHLEKYYRHRREVWDGFLDLTRPADQRISDLSVVPTPQHGLCIRW